MSDDPMIVNAQRQQEFNSVLASRTSQIDKLMGDFRAQLGKLSRDWQDAQFEEFRQQASNTARALDRFKEESRKLSSNLKEKQRLAEEYARIRNS